MAKTLVKQILCKTVSHQDCKGKAIGCYCYCHSISRRQHNEQR